MGCVIVTGGAGFIGSEVVRQLINHTAETVINVDKLTYAGNPEALSSITASSRYNFEQVDICDAVALSQVFSHYQPSGVIHLAAESHVDRSIDDPSEFVSTNILGTYQLLEVARAYWNGLQGRDKEAFRFLHVSTDEVYGSLGAGGLFTEESAYAPNSPYSASKASSNHLIRAWHKTYGLPVITAIGANCYGPYQFPEKLIPRVILNALAGKALPVYGNGEQVRDWLYVADYANALRLVFAGGRPGEVYNIGGHNEKTNLETVRLICSLLDELAPQHPKGIVCYEALIRHVEDRPAHDTRYALDTAKLEQALQWRPKETFTSGLRKTVQWYLDNRAVYAGSGGRGYQRERLGSEAEW